jgi:hypothetical protein
MRIVDSVLATNMSTLTPDLYRQRVLIAKKYLRPFPTPLSDYLPLLTGAQADTLTGRTMLKINTVRVWAFMVFEFPDFDMEF